MMTDLVKRRCTVCGHAHRPWQLLGGGYSANWFAALLREALPVAMCEVCIRKCFLNSQFVEPVGVAVLPDVEARSVRWGDVEKYLLRAKKKYGPRRDFEVTGYLSSTEIDDLLSSRTIFRSIHVSPVFGSVAILFSFEEKRSEGLKVDRIGGESFALTCESTRWKCIRTLGDFNWLQQSLTHRAAYLPPLPGPFVPSPLADSLCEDFLRFACINFASNEEALQAFLRPSFQLAKAALEVYRDAETPSVINGQKRALSRRMVSTIADKPAALPLPALEHAMRAMAESRQRSIEWTARIFEAACDLNVDVPQLSSCGSLRPEGVVQWQMQQSQQLGVWWRSIYSRISNSY